MFTIGDGVAIAAGAIVTKDAPPLQLLEKVLQKLLKRLNMGLKAMTAAYEAGKNI